MPLMLNLELGDSECLFLGGGKRSVWTLSQEMDSPDLKRGQHQGFLNFPLGDLFSRDCRDVGTAHRCGNQVFANNKS